MYHKAAHKGVDDMAQRLSGACRGLEFDSRHWRQVSYSCSSSRGSDSWHDACFLPPWALTFTPPLIYKVTHIMPVFVTSGSEDDGIA